MKKVLLCCLLILTPALCFAEYVNGYYRSNGTYVNGYNRSDRNNTVSDNYSYKGNYNPYTGSTGSNYYRNSESSQYYNGFGSSTKSSRW